MSATPAGSPPDPQGVPPTAACAEGPVQVDGSPFDAHFAGWGRLPDAVRARLAEVAATAVGGLPVADLPVQLRRLARFTPAKRAKLGAAALTA
ncbi:MAG: RNA-binding protein, partial [Pseudonocardia sp.]|nr:RNA-binding protein [Pseudonocardia sp.]